MFLSNLLLRPGVALLQRLSLRVRLWLMAMLVLLPLLILGLLLGYRSYAQQSGLSLAMVLGCWDFLWCFTCLRLFIKASRWQWTS